MKATVILAAAGLMMLGWAGQPAREEPAKPAAALSIQSVAFLSGAWRGQIEGGLAQEQWSAPEGNNVIGMFRWLKPDGTPIMFEIMAVTQEPEGVFLRLVHLNGKLVAREEKGDAVTLRLDQAGPTLAVFKGAESEKRVASATYERASEDALHVTIQFVDPARPALNFDFKREAAK